MDPYRVTRPNEPLTANERRSLHVVFSLTRDGAAVTPDTARFVVRELDAAGEYAGTLVDLTDADAQVTISAGQVDVLLSATTMTGHPVGLHAYELVTTDSSGTWGPFAGNLTINPSPYAS